MPHLLCLPIEPVSSAVLGWSLPPTLGWTLRYTLHWTLGCTLHRTLQCPLGWTLYPMLHPSLQCTLRCTLYSTLHPRLHSTLQWTLHPTLGWTLHWTLQGRLGYRPGPQQFRRAACPASPMRMGVNPLLSHSGRWRFGGNAVTGEDRRSRSRCLEEALVQKGGRRQARRPPRLHP